MQKKLLLPFLLFLFCSISAFAANGQWVSRFKIQNKNNETLLVGSDAQVSAGERYGSVIVLWGNLDFAGTADEMVVLSGSAHLRPGSRIEKSLVVLGGNLQRDDGAFVQGDTIQFQAPSDFPKPFLLIAPFLGFAATGAIWFLAKLFWLLFNWLSGVLAYKVAPQFFRQTEQETLSKKFKNGVVGFLAVLLFVPSILLFVISLIGIPFLPLYLLLYITGISCAYIVVGSLVGQYLPPVMDVKKYSPLRLLYGLTVVEVLRALLPIVGMSLIFALMLVTWGAILRVSKQKVFSKSKSK